MASYFEEHNCEPGEPERALLELARTLLSGQQIDLGSVDFSDWDQRLPPPAARLAVLSLPTVRVTAAQADKGLKCPVCLLEFEEDEGAKKMPCEHLFHSGCILPWLGKELPTDDPEYEEYKKDKVRRQQREHRLEYLHGAMYT